jgi:hypothetical protein
MEPGPFEKQIKCLEGARTNNPEVVLSSPMNKCKMQKMKSGCRVKKQLPPPRWPSPVLSPSCGHGSPEGGFLCRKDKPSWLRQISTSEVGDRGGELQVTSSKVVVVVRRIARALLAEFIKILPLFPGQAPLRDGEIFLISGPVALLA